VSVLCGVSEWAVQVHCVAVASPDPGMGYVSRGLEVGHDRLNGALGDTDDLGQIPRPRVGILGDRDQGAPVRSRASSCLGPVRETSPQMLNPRARTREVRHVFLFTRIWRGCG